MFDAVVIMLAIALFATLLFTILSFFGNLITLLAARPIYLWIRRLNHTPSDLTLPFIYAPLVSTISALLAGAGINKLTASSFDISGEAMGLVDIVGSLVVIGWGGIALTRLARKGGDGLARTRYRLRQYSDLRTGPADYTTALAWVRRVQRVGDRLVARADGLTFAHWMRTNPRAVFPIIIAWVYNVLIFIMTDIALATRSPRFDVFDWVVFGVLAATVVLGPSSLVMRWSADRWLPRTIGRELKADARRAEAAILRHRPSDALVQRIRRWLTHGMRNRPLERPPT